MAGYNVYKDSNHSNLSLITKMFFWRYFTLGICPLLSELNYNFFLIEMNKGKISNKNFGFYDDLTSIWFKMRGAGIVSTSIMRIFILFLQGLFKFLKFKCRILYDQR